MSFAKNDLRKKVKRFYEKERKKNESTYWLIFELNLERLFQGFIL